jgi:neutral ceramidase
VAAVSLTTGIGKMKRKTITSGLCLAALACIWLARAVAADEPAMKAGFAEADITPEIGMEVPGGYGKAYCQSIHDPCKVRAAVFDDGHTCVALVGVDAGFVFRPMVREARERICERTGIPVSAVLVGASHSHSSGPLGIVQPGQYDHAPEPVQRLAYDKSSCADARYVSQVRDRIVDAVCAADQAKVDVRCGVGMGTENKVAFNRRVRMKNGVTYTHPGQNNPDAVDYAGPSDPTVGVIGVWDGAGKLLGCVVNFACHATTSPEGISANYIYYLERTIRGALNQEAVVVFLQGYSGDVTQVDNLSPYGNPDGERWAQIVGGRIGAEAVKTLLSMTPGQLIPLDARSTLLQINRRTPDSERVQRCRQLVEQDPQTVGATEWAFAKEIVLLDAVCAVSPVAEVEVQAIQIGPVVLLANPGELFCQYGLDARSRSPFPITFPVGYANDFTGYVPTEEAFGPQGGGYETRLTSCTNLEVRAGRRIMDAALELAGQMQPGPLPQPPRAAQGQPWAYGNVPAELK